MRKLLVLVLILGLLFAAGTWLTQPSQAQSGPTWLPFDGPSQPSNPTELGSQTTVTATIQAGTSVSYVWDFGDGTSGNGVLATHQYASTGECIATVTATKSLGSVVATTQVLVIKPQPVMKYFYLSATFK